MNELKALEKKLDLLIQVQEKPYTVAMACEYMGISKSTLYKLTSERKIDFYKPNGQLLYFKKKDLDDFVFENRFKRIVETIKNANV